MIPFIQNTNHAKLPYVVRSQDSGYSKRGYEGNFCVLVFCLIIGYTGVFTWQSIKVYIYDMYTFPYIFYFNVIEVKMEKKCQAGYLKSPTVL